MNTVKKILVLEDEKPLSRVIQAKLEKTGFHSYMAQSVEEGQRLLNKIKDIDAIWLDHYLLGEEDGLSFAKECKRDSKYKDIPIFLVSNTASQEKILQYRHLGVNKCYLKAETQLNRVIQEISSFLGSS